MSARAASLRASERVGWAWQVWARSSAVALTWMARVASAMSSPAWAEMIWAPRRVFVWA